jgi:hypothetical protein
MRLLSSEAEHAPILKRISASEKYSLDLKSNQQQKGNNVSGFHTKTRTGQPAQE